MDKRAFLTFLFFLVSTAAAFAADRVFCVQSMPVKPYDLAVKGFEEATGIETDRIILSRRKGEDIRRLVIRKKPSIILAVGMGALERVAAIEGAPVIHLMVLHPGAIAAGRKNIAGVRMQAAPDMQLDLFDSLSTAITRIGVIYSQENSGDFVAAAREAAGASRLDLLCEAVAGPREVQGALNRLKGRVDALWMLPDVSVVSGETVEMFLLASLENNIPLFTFSKKYADMGALLSIGVDPRDLGRQAGEMARRILGGADISTIATEYAERPKVDMNEKVADNLNIKVNRDILNRIGK